MQKGTTFWFTGLSGAGKTTLAKGLSHWLRQSDLPVELLDGDELRAVLSPALGFKREDRIAHVRRIVWLAQLLANHGIHTCVAVIAPYEVMRVEAKATLPHYVEIFCDAPMATVEQRDPKGLYAKARQGLIQQMTGIDDPYDRPQQPALHLHTDQLDAAQTLATLLSNIIAQDWLPSTQRQQLQRCWQQHLDQHAGLASPLLQTKSS